MKRILILITIVLALTACSRDRSDENTEDISLKQEESEEDPTIYIEEEEEASEWDQEDTSTAKLDIDPDSLYSYNAILLDAKTGHVLFDYDADKKIYPASLTKILTTLVALEKKDQGEEMGKSFSISQKAYDELKLADASMAGFEPGEVVNLEDLVYGTMMPSGADAALGLSICASGSPEDHVKEMNALAEDIGLENSHFANVEGLHDPENYSTARDLAKLFKYGLNNEDFREIITTKAYNTSHTSAHPDGIDMSYKCVDYTDGLFEEGTEILGGKTGYTEEAGYCLASLAKVDGDYYILVTTAAPDLYDNFEDALTVYSQLAKAKEAGEI